jgi:hypothetical protein
MAARGYLTVDGQDVGDTLIAENLARPLIRGQFFVSEAYGVVSVRTVPRAATIRSQGHRRG